MCFLSTNNFWALPVKLARHSKSVRFDLSVVFPCSLCALPWSRSPQPGHYATPPIYRLPHVREVEVTSEWCACLSMDESPSDPSQYYPPLWKRHPDKIGVRGSVPSISEARDTPPRFFRTWKNIREIGYCFNPSASPCKQWLIVMNALFQPFDQGIGIDAGFRKTEIQWEFIYISFLTNRSCGYRGYVALSSSDVYAPIYLLWFRLFKKERYFMETL